MHNASLSSIIQSFHRI